MSSVSAQVDRILIGLDGSDNGRRALDWAILLGHRFDAELLVVHVVGLLAHLEAGPTVLRHSHIQHLRHAFETEWCAPLAGTGLRHRQLLIDGSAVPVLLDVAEREAADLIVVGSRGASGTSEFVLGSTSHQVAEQAGRPVLIVPPVRSGAEALG